MPHGRSVDDEYRGANSQLQEANVSEATVSTHSGFRGLCARLQLVACRGARLQDASVPEVGAGSVVFSVDEEGAGAEGVLGDIWFEVYGCIV